jgi:hypothetical protein
MTSHQVHGAEIPQSTGHGRGARNRDEPRNNTVCCTVTASEQRAIDAISMCTHLRRSAIMTEVITRFAAAVAESPRAQSKRNALLDFLDECREQVQQKSELFEELTKEGRK